MVDIDRFKKVNDTYGHGTGDEAIRTVARILQTHLREPDVFCRYGGEEFAAILSEVHGDPMEVGEHALSYLAWTWNPWGCSTGGVLIRDWSGTPEPGIGEGYKAHLLTQNPYA